MTWMVWYKPNSVRRQAWCPELPDRGAGQEGMSQSLAVQLTGVSEEAPLPKPRMTQI